MTTSIITRGSGVSIAGRRSRGLSPAFSRASAAYQSDGRVVGIGVPRFETVDGRRGVLVEEGTTNLVALARLDTDSDGDGVADGFYRNDPGGAYCVELVEDSEAFTGRAQQLAISDIPSGKNLWIRQDVKGISSGDRITFSCRIKADIRVAAQVKIYLHLGAGGIAYAATLARSTGGYQTYVVQNYDTTGMNQAALLCLISADAPGSNATLDIDWLQIEKKPYATSFVDGTRAAESLSIPTAELLSVQEGSVECWARPNWSATAAVSNKVIVSAFSAGASNGAYWFGYSATQNKWGVPDAGLYSGVQTFAAQTRFYLVLTWDSATLKLYMNGSLVGTAAKPANFALAADGLMRIGGFVSGNYQFDGLIDGLRIYRRALTDEEIAAHAAGNIVAKDCYHYPFDGDLWPAPGSLGAVVAPAVTTRPGRVDVVTRRGSVDIITRPGKLEVIRR